MFEHIMCVYIRHGKSETLSMVGMFNVERLLMSHCVFGVCEWQGTANGWRASCIFWANIRYLRLFRQVSLYAIMLYFTVP